MKKLILTFIAGCALVGPAWASDDPPGPAVDKHGNTAADPTKNVEAIVLAEARRQDDLRLAEARFNTAQAIHTKEMAELRSAQEKELRLADRNESAAIRLVDKEDVNKTAALANNAIALLAKQTTELATSVQKTLTDTAVAVESRQTSFAGEVNKRLSALELSSSERIGKQQVYDPQAERVNALVEKLANAQSMGAGQSQGMNSTTVLFLAIAGLLLTGIGLMFNQSRKNAQQLIKLNGAAKAA